MMKQVRVMILVYVIITILACTAYCFKLNMNRNNNNNIKKNNKLDFVGKQQQGGQNQKQQQGYQGKVQKTSSDYDNEDNSIDNNIPVARSFAQKTITGKNVIVCRPFSIDSGKNYDFLGSYTTANSVPIYPLPEIAFLGRSNVGKSSLFNCLTGLNKKVAVESKTPGRTQCINQFKCKDKEGDICIFTDLPGYGYAKMSKTQQDDVSFFLKDYLRTRGALRLAVVLIDVRREPQQLDSDMLRFLYNGDVPHIVVATKCDKIKEEELIKSLTVLNEHYDLPPGYPIPFSSFTGMGRKDLWRVIKAAILGELIEEVDDDQFDIELSLQNASEENPII